MYLGVVSQLKIWNLCLMLQSRTECSHFCVPWIAPFCIAVVSDCLILQTISGKFSSKTLCFSRKFLCLYENCFNKTLLIWGTGGINTWNHWWLIWLFWIPKGALNHPDYIASFNLELTGKGCKCLFFTVTNGWCYLWSKTCSFLSSTSW